VKDVQADRWLGWFNGPVQTIFQQYGFFDPEGVFIGDGSYLFKRGVANFSTDNLQAAADDFAQDAKLDPKIISPATTWAWHTSGWTSSKRLNRASSIFEDQGDCAGAPCPGRPVL
jgi:hypothetical protein